ncbi:hypothetical protein QEZ40_006200 [Streptomyces katrae]|uniref:PBS lyase n=1 Tax=Streptomyces katrae TaxID=68223 RepID=A0ABT7H398_9ACTN|nr:hypothetical protein [Streptomyces katrae]MDK9500381.1 hypothetical protein [Streptomyces katrae]
MARDLLNGDTVPVAGRLLGHGPEAWIAFDEEVRRLMRSPGTREGARRLEARLCHPDGRIREATLAAWRRPPVQLVLLRCADRVPQVRRRARRVLGRLVAQHPVRNRDRARRALNRPMADDPAHVLTALVPFALRLGGREHGGWAVEQLEAALSGRYSLLAAWWRPGLASTTWSWNSLTARQREGMFARLTGSADRPTRRFAARVAVACGQYGARELARRAAVERDPVTGRTWTDAALAALAAGGPDDAAVDALLGSRSAAVRAAGVTALRRAGRAAEAVDHLADRAGQVRACARWLLRQDGGDPYASYRELVTDPERVSGYAVKGFREVAEQADAPLLYPLLHDPDGAVRAAALAALRGLGHVLDDAVLLALLEDPAASVSREAALSLLRVAERLDSAALADRTGPEWPLHTRRAAFRLLRGRGGSAELRASVAMMTDPDPVLGLYARSTVVNWNWLSTLDEGEAHQAELGVLLARAARVLDVHRLRLL